MLDESCPTKNFQTNTDKGFSALILSALRLKVNIKEGDKMSEKIFVVQKPLRNPIEDVCTYVNYNAYWGKISMLSLYDLNLNVNDVYFGARGLGEIVIELKQELFKGDNYNV